MTAPTDFPEDEDDYHAPEWSTYPQMWRETPSDKLYFRDMDGSIVCLTDLHKENEELKARVERLRLGCMDADDLAFRRSRSLENR